MWNSLWREVEGRWCRRSWRVEGLEGYRTVGRGPSRAVAPAGQVEVEQGRDRRGFRRQGSGGRIEGVVPDAKVVVD